MQKWEFKTVLAAYGGEDTDKRLNEAGMESWELVWVNPTNSPGTFSYVFKRPLTGVARVNRQD